MPTRPVHESVQEYARGVAGGLLFSLPLFYTMEVWAIGLAATPERLLAFVAGTAALLVAYNHLVGLSAEHSLRESVLESVEELGLGLLLSAGLLALLGRVPAESWSFETLGLVTIGGLVAAVGISVGTAQLGEAPDDDTDRIDDEDRRPQGLGDDLIVALCGAVLVAANVAPTEEVRLLAAEMSPVALLGLVALSLAVGGGILYHSEFRGSTRLGAQAMGPLRGTVVTYAVALAASVALLGVFGQIEATGVAALPRMAAVLGFPAMLGASAGRLLLLPSSGAPS